MLKVDLNAQGRLECFRDYVTFQLIYSPYCWFSHSKALKDISLLNFHQEIFHVNMSNVKVGQVKLKITISRRESDRLSIVREIAQI